MKRGDEYVRRPLVKLHRAADLLDPAAVEDDDAVGERHRLGLVVGDIDHRRSEARVQARDLQPHLHAQRRVEIGERLVQQEDAWGLRMIARPMATRWRWPPDSSRGVR